MWECEWEERRHPQSPFRPKPDGTVNSSQKKAFVAPKKEEKTAQKKEGGGGGPTTGSGPGAKKKARAAEGRKEHPTHTVNGAREGDIRGKERKPPKGGAHSQSSLEKKKRKTLAAASRSTKKGKTEQREEKEGKGTAGEVRKRVHASDLLSRGENNHPRPKKAKRERGEGPPLRRLRKKPRRRHRQENRPNGNGERKNGHGEKEAIGLLTVLKNCPAFVQAGMEEHPRNAGAEKKKKRGRMPIGGTGGKKSHFGAGFSMEEREGGEEKIENHEIMELGKRKGKTLPRSASSNTPCLLTYREGSVEAGGKGKGIVNDCWHREKMAAGPVQEGGRVVGLKRGRG